MSEGAWIDRPRRGLVRTTMGQRNCVGFRVPPAQDDKLKKTRSNPGNERRQKDLDIRHGVPAATEYR